MKGKPREQRREQPLWLRRLGWMAALWAGGVAALWLVASLIRAIMHAAGMR
ncbi:MAG: hypothetical protein JWP72_2840 [Massilia sp.]|jgi:hypothetical protein|nr:hypothetical protein [Massilia sp.]MDB5792594.1 hypothetical protein [Massilia sp.]